MKNSKFQIFLIFTFSFYAYSETIFVSNDINQNFDVNYFNSIDIAIIRLMDSHLENISIILCTSNFSYYFNDNLNMSDNIAIKIM